MGSRPWQGITPRALGPGLARRRPQTRSGPITASPAPEGVLSAHCFEARNDGVDGVRKLKAVEL